MLVQKLFKTPVCEMKWAMYFDEWDLNWKDIFYSPFLSCTSTKLRYFQFKILHRYLAVNKLLAQIGIIDSDLCSFCKREKENIQHFFWDCTELVSFWQNIQTHILKNSVHLDMRNVILGLFETENLKFNLSFSMQNTIFISVNGMKVNQITMFLLKSWKLVKTLRRWLL